MMMFIVLVYTFLGCVLAREIPPYVHLCKRHDPELEKCMTNTIYEIIPYLKKGIPEMDLPPLDPLHVANVKVNTGSTGAVDIEVTISNSTVTGLLGLEIASLNADIDNGKFSGILKIPWLRIQATYRMKGKMMLFELDSTGRSDLNVTNVTFDVKWYAEVYKKNKEQHLNFNKIDMKILTADAQIYLENLFRGNELLTDTVNAAINDNMKNLQADLNPIAEETMGQLCLDYFNRPHAVFSINKLYPED